MPKTKILVIDDDNDICLLLERFLTRNDFEISTAQNGRTGMHKIDTFKPDLIMTDFKLGDINGVELLQYAKSKNANVPVIIITGYSDIKVAISVMKQGAYDYVTKPLFPDEILMTIKKALSSVSEKSENNSDSEASVAPSSGSAKSSGKSKRSGNKAPKGYIFGNSAVSKNLMKQIDLVSPTNFSVIIYGESGAGKEAIAREIHNRSKRAGEAFVAMDCGAISKELAGSELFGHEKGSFTGALNQKIGHFELANGGTLFLDEIANLSYEVQVSLLRVVQEQKVKRLGGNKEISLDVRIIIASNENLPEAIKKGKFREDLYHRFNEFSITVPPLRERGEDIMLFAEFFLDKTNAELDKKVTGFSKEVIECFMSYPWYGNLRELNNIVKRTTLLSEGNVVEAKVLPFELLNHGRVMFADEPQATEPSNATFSGNSNSSGENATHAHVNVNDLKAAAQEAEFDTIMNALRQTNFNKSKAARYLNIDRKTLYNKMKALNM